MSNLFQRLSERGSPSLETDCITSRREAVEMKNINQQTSPADISKIVVKQVLESVDRQLKEKKATSR